MAELPSDEESQEVLDVFDNIIVVRRSSFFESDKVCVAQVPEKDDEAEVKWIEITEAVKIDQLDGLIFHCMELTSSNASDDVRKYNNVFEAIQSCLCSNLLDYRSLLSYTLIECARKKH